MAILIVAVFSSRLSRYSRQREAFDLLVGVFGKFAEGFETVNLLAARDLLDTLK